MVTRALEAAGPAGSTRRCRRGAQHGDGAPHRPRGDHRGARETGGIVTVEEHTTYGGLGGAVAEVVVTTHPVPMRILGFPGVFAPTGSAAWLFEHFGLTPAGIRDAALELLGESANGE